MQNAISNGRKHSAREYAEAIDFMNEILKSQVVDRQFFTLRENAKSDKIDVANIADKVSDEYVNFDNNKFNQFFEMYKFNHGNNDKGYGDIMNNDKDIPSPEKINFSQFLICLIRT